jgi:hypothetical protein
MTFQRKTIVEIKEWGWEDEGFQSVFPLVNIDAEGKNSHLAL